MLVLGKSQPTPKPSGDEKKPDSSPTGETNLPRGETASIPSQEATQPPPVQSTVVPESEDPSPEQVEAEKKEQDAKVQARANEVREESKKITAPPEVRTSGNDPEVSDDIYQKVYNAEVQEVSVMSNDELQDHIHTLMEISQVVKIRWKASYITLAERMEAADADEKKRVAERDRQYKPRVVTDKKDGEKKPRAARAPGLSNEEKAVKAFAAALGITEAEARERMKTLPGAKK